MATKEAEAPVADLSAILALLQDVKAGQDALGSRLDDLEGRVDTQAKSLPRITPTEAYSPWESDSPEAVMARLGPNGEMIGERRSTLKDANGRTLSDDAVRMHPPTYQDGQSVRINPDSAPYGFPKGLTWGDRLKLFRATGNARIIRALHQSLDGEWRYRIKVDKVGGMNGILMVADHELLPA